MATYEYACTECGLVFERSQSMTEEPIRECPECRGRVRRLISAGTGFIVRESGSHSVHAGGRDCSLEREGHTCCGRGERCGKPTCGGRE